jgi:integrase
MDLGKADKTLRNLKPQATAYTKALGDGICCRVAPNGTRTLELRARLHGKVSRWPLGFYPSTTISDAAAKAADFRALLKNGLSPKVAQQRATNNEIPRNVKEAAARFIEGHVMLKLRPNSAKEAKRLIEVEVLTELGNYPLQQLERADLTGLIERKARALRSRKKKGVAANRLAAVIGKFIGWCAVQGWLSTDLATKLPRPAVETPKVRMLDATDTNNEVGVIWNLLAELAEAGTGIPAPHGRILQLLALTGARCSEITRLTAAHINLKAGTLEITDGKTAASNRLIPMTPSTRSIIEQALVGAGDGLLFPSSRAHTIVPSNEISRSCRKLVKMAGVAPFTPHDLRRTAISIMAEAGVDGDIRRRITGHQAADVHGKIYDRALRLEDMRVALTTIEAHYTAAASKATARPSNVVAIPTRRERG